MTTQSPFGIFADLSQHRHEGPETNLSLFFLVARRASIG